MIKSNNKIGIVYSGQSEKYADELKHIIQEYGKAGYPIEPMKVDSEIVDGERSIEDHVFNNLRKCNYGIVFLSKDINIEYKSYKYSSKPNVLIELGFLRGCLDGNNTWCITDFPYQEIEESIYLKPSDISAEKFEEIDPKNSYNSIKRVFEKFISANNIVKLNNYNANDLVNSLILNPGYNTNYTELFSNRQLEMINKYSVQWQLNEIFDMWLNEKNKLKDAEKIIYLFERVVFFPFFPEKIIGSKLNDLLYIDIDDDNGYIVACCRILEYINDYEIYKRERQPNHYTIYKELADGIEKELEIFENRKIAPIVECVAKNYMGLAFLNAYFGLHEAGIVQKEEKVILEKSKKAFMHVIELSRGALKDKAEVFYAFAYFNLARLERNLGNYALFDYIKARNQRKMLSKVNYFPEIFRLNFLLERIYVDIEYNEYLNELDRRDNYEEELNNLSKELEKIKKTPVADVSLFVTLEDKLNKGLKNID